MDTPKAKGAEIRIDDWSQGLAQIDWSQFRTAYGVATDVPGQLRRLYSADQVEAMDASHDLWCGLCHQHVQIGSAALPALPFLLEVFETANDKLKVELLDIFLGFAICTNPINLDQWAKNLGHPAIPVSPWLVEVRSKLLAQASKIVPLKEHPHPDMACFADRICQELGIDPPPS